MKKLFIMALALMALSACNNQTATPQGGFRIEGEVSGAEGKTLVFEHSGLQGIIPLDSVKLGTDGKFSFSWARPEAPERRRRAPHAGSKLPRAAHIRPAPR